jgi:hypothetical protein
MECVKCNRTFMQEDCIASIRGSIMGHEHTDIFYFCLVCHLYTIKGCWDNFTGGEESLNVRGALDKVQGDERVELIRRCEQPWDKKCRCDAHREYFNDTLD